MVVCASRGRLDGGEGGEVVGIVHIDGAGRLRGVLDANVVES